MPGESGQQTESAPRGLALIGPGLLVAATGVGAGDLATGALTGSRLGTAVLWAVILGAFIKFVLNEGLARWQLATDSTVIEGTRRQFGRVAVMAFLAYLCLWSFFVGAALMSACGIAAHAIFPLTTDAATNKQIYGIVHSLLAVALVTYGGYRLFEKAMRICIGVMFVTVIVAAVAVKPDWGNVFSGLVIPRIPQLGGDGLKWTVGLMGGVGGTVTILCYGYWIREENRSGLGELRACRLDLMSGYLVTAIFGICMVILGSRLPVDGGAGGASLIVALGENLRNSIGGGAGTAAKFAFLAVAWGAIASSMLGVWQSIPYLFADCWRLVGPDASLFNRDHDTTAESDLTKSELTSPKLERHPIYRGSLFAIAIVPAVGLFQKFETVQLAYAVVGAAFMPLLAVVLVALNGRESTIGAKARNSVLTSVFLIAVLVFFAWAGFYDLRDRIRKSDEPKQQPVPAAVN